MKRSLFLILLCMAMSSLYCMDWITKARKKKRSTTEKSIKKCLQIFVKTADGVITSVPIWKVDQITLLQDRLKEQGDTNSKENPVDISDIKIVLYYTLEGTNTINEHLAPMTAFIFKDVLTAFDHTLTKDKFCNFFGKVGDKKLEGHIHTVDQKNLINAAQAIGAERISLLILQNQYPPELYNTIYKTANVENYADSIINYLKGPQKNILKGHTGVIKCLACSPQGDYIVSGSMDETLIIWNAYTGVKEKILKGHEEGVTCVAYSPDGKYIVSGSTDETIILWDVETGVQKKIFKGHEGRVACILYSLDGDIISGSEDGEIIVWDMLNGARKKTVTLSTPEKNIRLYCMTYRPDKKYVIMGSSRGFFLCNTQTFSIDKFTENPVPFFAYDPNGKFLVSPYKDPSVQAYTGLIFYGMPQYKLIGYFIRSDYADDFVTCIACSIDGKSMVSGGRNGKIVIRKEKDKNIKVFNDHKKRVNCISYSPNGNYFASGSNDKTVIVWPTIDQATCDQRLADAALMKKNLKSVEQQCFVYRLYKATVKGIPTVINVLDDPDYRIYLNLPIDVQDCIRKYFPFEVYGNQQLQ